MATSAPPVSRSRAVTLRPTRRERLHHRRFVVGHTQVERALLARLRPHAARTCRRCACRGTGGTGAGRPGPCSATSSGRVHGGRAAVARAVRVSALDAARSGDCRRNRCRRRVLTGRPLWSSGPRRARRSCCLNSGRVSTPVHAVAELAGRRLVGGRSRWPRRSEPTSTPMVSSCSPWTRDGHLVVAEAARLGHQLGVR